MVELATFSLKADAHHQLSYSHCCISVSYLTPLFERALQVSGRHNPVESQRQLLRYKVVTDEGLKNRAKQSVKYKAVTSPSVWG